ncbi:MAG TPA: site-2 protease family protein, partial [Pirellulaceae bacterium]|nr:site-2 protease family protein [Pirellulaceae bacterium]
MDLCLIAETASDLNATLMYVGSILMVFAGLGFVIFVHELGHFLAAKACGVKCEKFYVGFDIPLPKIAGVQLPSKLFHMQWGETEYGIGILPLGGYVKMLGQDDDPRKFKEEQARARALAGGDASKEAIAETIAHDPRSYPAKSVPQRMLIISAGVIMNLIFAVIMGAAAYSMGVSYSPTIIGAASPGWAGWTSDLRPGDKIVQIGKNGRRDDQLRFIQDLQPQILLNGGDAKLDLLIDRNGAEEWKKITPTDPADLGVALVGISPASDAVVNENNPVAKHTPLAKLGDKLAGQRIVAINGEKIENHAQLQAYMARHFSEALKLTLVPVGEDAATGTQTEFELPAVPMRTLGIVAKLGPVVAVRENSPAAAAGFKPGDEVLTIDGQPVGDPLTLSQRMVAYIGKDVTVQIERKSADGKKSKTEDLKPTPEPPLYLSRGVTGFPGEKVAVEPLGLAFSITNEIAEVIPGSPADKAGLKAGDEISGAQFVISDEDQKKQLLGEWRKEFFDLITLKPNGKNWAFISGALQ